MSRNKTMERFFDEADFTPSHDEIFEHLIAHWTDYILPTIKCGDVTPNLVKAWIDGEPALNGYPPLFPDAIGYAKLEYDHRKTPVRITVEKDYQDYQEYSSVVVKCGVEGCGHTEVMGELGKLSQYASDLEKTIWNQKVSKLQERPNYWLAPCNGGELRVLFEIKPNKESAGRILRQLKFYEEQLRESSSDYWQLMVLITPDSRFDDLFKSQGVIPVRPILPLKHFVPELKVKS